MQLDIFSDFCVLASSNGILFYYTGEFSQNVIGAMSDTLKQRLEAVNATSQARRKVFSTFIEMAQNIMHYGGGDGPAPEDDDTAPRRVGRIGALAVGQYMDRFYVICGNPVHMDHVPRLREKLEPLRTMTLTEIKAAYREQLRNDETQDTLSKGAGLGFLTVARDATEPIEYHIITPPSRSDGQAELYLRAVI